MSINTQIRSPSITNDKNGNLNGKVKKHNHEIVVEENILALNNEDSQKTSTKSKEKKKDKHKSKDKHREHKSKKSKSEEKTRPSELNLLGISPPKSSKTDAVTEANSSSKHHKKSKKEKHHRKEKTKASEYEKALGISTFLYHS